MIGAAEFKSMKKSAILINASRGATVDEQALIEALQNGTIHGAGLDVFETEPLPADSPLLKMANVVALPHIGSATHETRHAMARNAAKTSSPRSRDARHQHRQSRSVEEMSTPPLAAARRATITDVAREAGTGKTSISRYLNGEMSVLSPELRARIEAASSVSTISRTRWRAASSVAAIA
jgi:Lactate dehydrogenase and related dehydrogenases